MFIRELSVNPLKSVFRFRDWPLFMQSPRTHPDLFKILNHDSEARIPMVGLPEAILCKLRKKARMHSYIKEFYFPINLRSACRCSTVSTVIVWRIQILSNLYWLRLVFQLKIHFLESIWSSFSSASFWVWPLTRQNLGEGGGDPVLGSIFEHSFQYFSPISFVKISRIKGGEGASLLAPPRNTCMLYQHCHLPWQEPNESN